MLKVTAVNGNILAQTDCDGIVNSANEYLVAGSGVCGAIYKAAGAELEPFTKRLAPLGLGCAVASPAFNIYARWIIHTRGPKFHTDPDPPRNLAAALESATRLANQLGVQRLAVPAISTGIYGYPVREAASILIRVSHSLREELTELTEVRFVLFDSNAYSIFLNLLDGEELDLRGRREG